MPENMPHSMDSGPKTAPARLRIDNALRSFAGDESELFAAVCAYVDIAKATDFPIERTIVEFKRVAHDAGFVHSLPTATTGYRDLRESVFARAVTLVIKRYYRPDIVENARPTEDAARARPEQDTGTGSS